MTFLKSLLEGFYATVVAINNGNEVCLAVSSPHYVGKQCHEHFSVLASFPGPAQLSITIVSTEKCTATDGNWVGPGSEAISVLVNVNAEYN